MSHRTATITIEGSSLLGWLVGTGLFFLAVYALEAALTLVIARLTPEVNLEIFTEAFLRWEGVALYFISIIPVATCCLLFYIASRLEKIRKLLESKVKEP